MRVSQVLTRINRGWPRLFICVAALVPFACGAASIGNHAATVANQPASIWSNAGATLPSGHRVAIATDGNGWVLTQPFVNNELDLSKVSLKDGSLLGTYLVDNKVDGFSSAGLTADSVGHLWITYGSRVVRFDELSGAVTNWSIPPVAPRIATDYPLTGSAEADVWYAGNKLLFVRNNDQRLYEFDPTNATFSVASELPITTTYISSIATKPSGEIAITGSLAGAADFSPASAQLAAPGAQPGIVAGILAVCTRPSGFTYIHTTGVVSGDDSSTLATMQRPQGTSVPLTCDSAGNLFVAGVTEGQLVVTRLSPSGISMSVSDGLIPAVVASLSGPINTYANPGVVGLVPDLQGGVWVVSEAGINTSTNQGSSYPSLAHATFGP